VKNLMTFGAATSPVLGFGWTGEAAGARRTVPPVHTVQGTGLPIAGPDAYVGVVGLGMRAVQVQGIGVDRAKAAVTDPGIAPRRGPVRC
jgi:hypothetical protein